MFLSGIPLSQVLGTPISSLLLKVHWFGYSGWRWLLILEGLPAVVFGILTFFYLTDRPEQARWLGEEERAWINGEIEREEQAKQHELKITAWQAFYHRDVILLCLVWFLGSCASGGLLALLPKFIQKFSGFSSAQVALMARGSVPCWGGRP